MEYMAPLKLEQLRQNSLLLQNWFLNLPNDRALTIHLTGKLVEYNGSGDEETSSFEDINRTYNIHVANVYMKDGAFCFIHDQVNLDRKGGGYFIPFQLNFNRIITPGRYRANVNCILDSLCHDKKNQIKTSFGFDVNYDPVFEFPIRPMDYDEVLCKFAIYPHLQIWPPYTHDDLMYAMNKYEPLFK